MSKQYNDDMAHGEAVERKWKKEQEQTSTIPQMECSACKLLAPANEFMHQTKQFGVIIFCPVCGEKKANLICR